MPGGEFRFGTASIYMAQRANIQPNRTSQMRVITWTRFRRPQRHFLSTSAAFIVSARGKLGLKPVPDEIPAFANDGYSLALLMSSDTFIEVQGNQGAPYDA